MGYFGYETIKLIEKTRRPPRQADPIGTPDILLMQSEELAVVDNLSGQLYLIVYADPAVPNAYQKRKPAWRSCARNCPALAAALARPGAAQRGQLGIWRRRLQAGGAARARNTSSTATSCKWCSASACACRLPSRRCRCIARCAA